MPNHGLIARLPDDCVVETPATVDRNGVHPEIARRITTRHNGHASTRSRHCRIWLLKRDCKGIMSWRSKHLAWIHVLSPQFAPWVLLDAMSRNPRRIINLLKSLYLYAIFLRCYIVFRNEHLKESWNIYIEITPIHEIYSNFINCGTWFFLTKSTSC